MKRKSSPKKQVVFGQPSWRLQSSHVEAFVTELGGHLAPVVFDRRHRRIQPYALPPWWNETLPADTPPIIQVLRGDFFCLPFGANAEPFRGERHQVHGETANRKWEFEALEREAGHTTLHLSMNTTVRRGRVDKRITLVDGHHAIYCQHVLSGMNVLGIEDLTGFFHYGLAQSARRNCLSELGEQTCFRLKPDQALRVNYIMAVAEIPKGFDCTKRIEARRESEGVRLISTSGKAVEVPLRPAFLQSGRL